MDTDSIADPLHVSLQDVRDAKHPRDLAHVPFRVGLYCITDVRLITFRPRNRDSFVRISSCTPSTKYAFVFSSLRFPNGNTAMLRASAVDR